MRLVISDTGPINYLVLIGHIDLLPTLFEKVVMPVVIRDEPADLDAPLLGQESIANPPYWVEVWEAPAYFNDALLAPETMAKERLSRSPRFILSCCCSWMTAKGVLVAAKKGLAVTGTLGVLDIAAQRGLLDFAEAFKQLRNTTFRCPEGIMTGLLNSQKRRDA